MSFAAKALLGSWQVFNSRTCQLVLGAGALAAAGLRSITAKHLAMAAQCVGAIMGLHPALAALLTGPLPHSRRAILLPDFERLSQVTTVRLSWVQRGDGGRCRRACEFWAFPDALFSHSPQEHSE